ncbi:MAG: 2-isopropylmalate synthase [Oscillospiraceae bacterium]|nr:2-isopropylmalate synthase [Oscillospiraceae bacterium]
MKNAEKYTRGYFMPPASYLEWTQKEYIKAPPLWCSVDLRDGNQALIIPMSLEEKLEFWKLLVKAGFKEIEIGFPAASDTEYEFCRALIEGGLIPDDVSIQVLTQSRKHIIEKTFDALRGCKNAVVHLYNSTSAAQREQVFRKSKQEIIDIAVLGAEICAECREKTEGNFRFEYSPESFTGTEPEFALDVCNAVIDVWKPTADSKVIINLPGTVEVSMPHVYASQIEYMCKNLNRRENLIISLHPHNDRGCAVADAELGLLAGADRVEGTLFGNGERTGNVDLITLAMNLYSHGINPGLDFSDISAITAAYERITGMRVYERQPYSGELVFAAFSGSHQDAIAKGMKWREEKNPAHWNVPYLAIDPLDIGREYDGDVIRINSQSGKGGIGYLMEQKFGFILPAKMRENVGYFIKGISDREHKELSPQEVYIEFLDNYVKFYPLKFESVSYAQKGKIATVFMKLENTVIIGKSSGNGRLDAAFNAFKKALNIEYSILDYKEHSLEKGSTSKAVAYVAIEASSEIFWGVGIHEDIIEAAIFALVSAINNSGLISNCRP